MKKYFHSVGIYPAGFPENKMDVSPRGWYVKIWGGGYQKSGIPDILACVNGYFVGAEIKAQDGTPSDLQLLNVQRIKGAGGFALVLYPSKFAEFKAFIDGLARDEFNQDQMPDIWK